ncbi:histidine kinase [Cereibacter changlensis JA139]|uniref:histidine kinase n=3 Tax=Cereibacter changlensis TaxID=402884 RepID=A0A2T4JRC0_9RHOB|nr:histidine kinase [Cereibacter changlensis JA139]PZX54509.1 two-component sensor histidine kinase [Cereibacter changlensis]
MGRQVAAFDWSRTSLGPMENWPAALRISVSNVLNSPFPAFVAWGPDLITIHNDAFRPILGMKPAPLGKPMAENWAEAWEAVSPFVEATMRGESVFFENHEVEIDRSGQMEKAYFTFAYSPLRDEEGVVRGLMDTVVETTSSVEAERKARIRNGELMHRMKNTLAIVSAIANQTYRSSQTVKEANERLLRRLTTLGNAQSVLMSEDHEAADIRAVVESSLAPFRQAIGQIKVEGQPLHLAERHVFSLALALNELASNAMKYGALTVPEGRVRLGWRTDGEDFVLEWRETGGPAVTEPASSGFGSFLIRSVLADDFNGEVTLDYRRDGVVCRLVTAESNLAFRRSAAHHDHAA